MKYIGRILVVTFAILLFYLGFGVPVHDFNLWKLKMAYAEVPHPEDSVLLEKKTYPGGPSEHGSLRCTYAIGQVRFSSGSQEVIRRAYENFFVTNKRLPVTVLFPESYWELELPWMTWKAELWDKYKNATGTVYLVYAAEEDHPYWGDLRCDD